jgi:hypothetical protein
MAGDPLRAFTKGPRRRDSPYSATPIAPGPGCMPGVLRVLCMAMKTLAVWRYPEDRSVHSQAHQMSPSQGGLEPYRRSTEVEGSAVGKTTEGVKDECRPVQQGRPHGRWQRLPQGCSCSTAFTHTRAEGEASCRELEPSAMLTALLPHPQIELQHAHSVRSSCSPPSRAEFAGEGRSIDRFGGLAIGALSSEWSALDL